MSEEAHQDQTPWFWDELSAEEREIYHEFNKHETFRQVAAANADNGNSQAVKQILANLYSSQQDAERQGEQKATRPDLGPAARAPETDEQHARKEDVARRRESEAAEEPQETPEVRVARVSTSLKNEPAAERAERLEREQKGKRRTKSASKTKKSETEPTADTERKKRHRRKATGNRPRSRPSTKPAGATDKASDHKALEEAETTPAILRALARLLWKDRNGEECPDKYIPTEADLCGRSVDSPASPYDEASKRLDAILADRTKGMEEEIFQGEDPKQYHWAWGKIFKQRLFATLLAVEADGRVHCPPSTILEDIESVHRRWLAMPNGPDHPLAPIVESWQQRPLPTEADGRKKTILGTSFIKEPHHKEDTAPSLDVGIPGLIPHPPDLFSPQPAVPSLIRTLLTTNVNVKQRVGRTPLSAVLWLEGLVNVRTEVRDGRLHTLELTRREICKWAGWKPSNWQADYAQRQTNALFQMNQTRVSIGEGWYVPLIVQYVEGPHLDSRVSVLVRLPPESQVGPQVPRTILRRLIPSSLAWIGFLNICIHLDRYGARNGKLIQPTRPKVIRNEQGQILDANDQPVVYKSGKPVKRWSDNRAVPTGDREENPARTRYPTLGKNQLIALFYPLNPPVNAEDRRDKWSKTKTAIKRITREDGIVVEETGHGWRIMPGPWSYQSNDPF